MRKAFILLIIACLMFCGCAQETPQAAEPMIEQVIYNYNLDYYEYDTANKTLIVYETERATKQEDKPIRYYVYEDYTYLKHYLPDIDITVIFEYTEDKPFTVHADEVFEYYGQFDNIMSLHPLMQESNNAWASKEINWLDHPGIQVPDFNTIEVTGVVRDRVFSEDYILRAGATKGTRLTHGQLIDCGIKNKAIYGTMTFEQSPGRPIKCALYDDLCRMLYKKFKRQSCQFSITVLCRAEFRFGEVTPDWPAIIIEGPTTTNSEIFERIAKHEQVTYGEINELVVSKLHAPYGVLVEDINQVGLTDVAVNY